eukprot:scaffold122576_cov49-Attheya_sp.AAC.3
MEGRLRSTNKWVSLSCRHILKRTRHDEDDHDGNYLLLCLDDHSLSSHGHERFLGHHVSTIHDNFKSKLQKVQSNREKCEIQI